MPARRPFLRRIPILLLSVLALGACASTGTGDGDTERGSTTRIVQAELENLVQLDAYQAIERLRPRWLRRRGNRQPTVVLAGAPGQDLNILRTIRALDVREMRFMSAADATTRYGTGYDGGAIIVQMKGG
jgi:hypothetical protein